MVLVVVVRTSKARARPSFKKCEETRPNRSYSSRWMAKKVVVVIVVAVVVARGSGSSSEYVVVVVVAVVSVIQVLLLLGELSPSYL